MLKKKKTTCTRYNRARRMSCTLIKKQKNIPPNLPSKGGFKFSKNRLPSFEGRAGDGCYLKRSSIYNISLSGSFDYQECHFDRITRKLLVRRINKTLRKSINTSVPAYQEVLVKFDVSATSQAVLFEAARAAELSACSAANNKFREPPVSLDFLARLTRRVGSFFHRWKK